MSPVLAVGWSSRELNSLVHQKRLFRPPPTIRIIRSRLPSPMKRRGPGEEEGEGRSNRLRRLALRLERKQRQMAWSRRT
jgi:hypothetical protein